MTEANVIFCTVPDQATAEKIAHLLVKGKLAACVNILPKLTSIYTWQEKVETAEEHLLIIKALTSYYDQIEQTIQQNHPYEVPEIIALEITKGLPEYINWIATCHS